MALDLSNEIGQVNLLIILDWNPCQVLFRSDANSNTIP